MHLKLDWTPGQIQRLIDIEDGCVVSAGITPNGLLAEVIAGDMTMEQADAIARREGWVADEEAFKATEER